MNLQNTESAPAKAPALKSPWAQIVKAEPKPNEQPSASAAAKPQLTKQGSSVSAANGKQDSQTNALPSYAQAGPSQRQTSQAPAESKKPESMVSPEQQPPEAQLVGVDKHEHAPATPAASTSPVPPSDSSSSTAEKSREEGNATEASTSKSSEAEVTFDLSPQLLGTATDKAWRCLCAHMCSTPHMAAGTVTKAN